MAGKQLLLDKSFKDARQLAMLMYDHLPNMQMKQELMSAISDEDPLKHFLGETIDILFDENDRSRLFRAFCLIRRIRRADKAQRDRLEREFKHDQFDTVFSEYWRCLADVADRLDRKHVRKLCTLYNISQKPTMTPEGLFVTCKVMDDIKEDLTELYGEIRYALNEPRTALELRNYIGYPMRQATHGLAVILRQSFSDERDDLIQRGFSQDIKKLSEQWKVFGFDVREHENLSKQEIQDLIDDGSHDSLVNEPERELDEAFILCIFSHGYRGAFLTKNFEDTVFIETVEDAIGKAKHLAGAPKVIIVIACQGDSHRKEDPQMISLPCKTIYKDSFPVPQTSDTAVFYAAFRGYYVYITENGSLFVDALVNQMRNNWRNKSFQEMCDEVKNEVSKIPPKKGKKACQLPYLGTTLRKPLFFRPG